MVKTMIEAFVEAGAIEAEVAEAEGEGSAKVVMDPQAEAAVGILIEVHASMRRRQ